MARRCLSARAVAGAMLALALSGSAQASEDQYKHHTFKDWEVACDNVGSCEAAGYFPEDDKLLPAVLGLRREAGPVAPVQVKLSPMLEDDGKIGPLTVKVGKLTLRAVAADVALPPEQAAQLLSAMLDAEALTMADGQHRWTVSLAGAKAALLKIDDVQRRVGTVTALVRPGSKPAASVPAAVPPPVVRPLPAFKTREADAQLLPRISKTLKHGGCTDQPDFFGGEAYNEIYRLSATQVLLVLECARGAYQSSHALWVANDKPPYAAKRVQLPGPTGGFDGEVLNPGFGNGELSSFAKGRGINDCNSSASWAWTAQGFQRTNAASTDSCRGIPGGYPLQDYVARVVR